MGIMLTNLRIRNFRSIENIDLILGQTNILIGQNNSGKSNLLKAIDIALSGNRNISESDVFVSAGEKQKCNDRHSAQAYQWRWDDPENVL